jgi:hypothetical protein
MLSTARFVPEPTMRTAASMLREYALRGRSCFST